MEVAMHIIPMAYDALYHSLIDDPAKVLNDSFISVKAIFYTDDHRFRVYITQLVTGGTLRT